eukprot:g1963.t2
MLGLFAIAVAVASFFRITTVAFVHLYDRYLFDGTWTVERYLKDLKNRYGGIDSVLLWPTYTNIGIDDRSRFDYYRALPGGLHDLANVTAEFHRHNVKVLWGYNPWDQATRREGADWDVIAKLLQATGGDGFNGDTMMYIPEDRWTPLGWGYFGHKIDKMTYSYDFAPGVDKLKWLDPKGRHLTHVCDRWSKNRTSAIQLAFFNGDGYEAWDRRSARAIDAENIWGLFNRLTERDAALLRRAATLLRWAGRRNYTHDFEEWIPHTPEASAPEKGIFASLFRRRGDALWLVVNKGMVDAKVDVTIPSELRESHLFDLYKGVEVDISQCFSGTSLEIEGLGVSALLATRLADLSLQKLLSEMRLMTRSPLASFSPAWHVLHQEMDPMFSPKTFDPLKAPAGMVLLPRARFNFSVSGTALEGGCQAEEDPHGVCCHSKICNGDGSPDCQCAITGSHYFGAARIALDVQFPWEQQPGRNHRRLLDLGPLLMDQDLVTNNDFLSYLNASGYRPSDEFNFLKHWEHGRPKPGDEQKPEARAFCSFYGKRLPHSYEWQYAAQGLDGRRYPWGNELSDGRIPKAGHDPAAIGEHPEGTSPFGLRDMVGNVWQYTDSFRDEHTRSVLLRGSSRYQPKVSEAFPSRVQSLNWYFPPARELNKHSKYFLMSASYERAGTLGFRCAADVQGGAAAPYHYREIIDFVCSLRWSRRSPHLALGLADGDVQIWDIAVGARLQNLQGHRRRTCALVWADGELFSGSQDTSILRWDPREGNGRPTQRLAGHTEEVCGLSWSDDLQLLASGGNEGQVYLWSPAQPLAAARRLGCHTAACKALEWSPRGALLATGGGTADRSLGRPNTEEADGFGEGMAA